MSFIVHLSVIDDNSMERERSEGNFEYKHWHGKRHQCQVPILSLVVYEHLFQVATVYDALMIWPRKGGTKNVGPSQTVVLPTE